MKKKRKTAKKANSGTGSVIGAARATMSFYRGRSAGGKTNKSGKVYDHLQHITW
jgi:hypothetical protein